MDKNIDQNEVNKFAELADKWWDSSGEFSPSQYKPNRSEYIASKIDLKGKKVLDVGCGGLLAEALYDLGAESTESMLPVLVLRLPGFMQKERI